MYYLIEGLMIYYDYEKYYNLLKVVRGFFGLMFLMRGRFIIKFLVLIFFFLSVFVIFLNIILFLI